MEQAIVGSGPTPTPLRAHDLNRLDVYVAALEFHRVAARFLAHRRLGALRDQLDRASVSIVLNIAEGAGRFAPADKARHYVIARGSALECRAILDLLGARGTGSASDLRDAAGLLERITAMLTRLSSRMHERARLV
jgi:four helix bundle protein